MRSEVLKVGVAVQAPIEKAFHRALMIVRAPSETLLAIDRKKLTERVKRKQSKRPEKNRRDKKMTRIPSKRKCQRNTRRSYRRQIRC